MLFRRYVLVGIAALFLAIGPDAKASQLPPAGSRTIAVQGAVTVDLADVSLNAIG
jgi:hypothetical protein